MVASYEEASGSPLVPYVRYFDLSANGKKIAIGAPGHDKNKTITNEGRTRVFKLNDAGTAWEQHGPSIDGVNTNDRSGVSVGLTEDGKILVIGAYWRYHANGNNTGYIQVFESIGSTTVSHF